VSQSYPQGLLERSVVNGGASDATFAGNGAWLLVPEPDASSACAAAALAVAALHIRRR